MCWTLSRVRLAALAVPAAPIAPANVEPFWSVALMELMASATRLPVRVCPFAVRIAVPPFEPLVPQLLAPASRSVPEAAVMFTRRAR
jgi:hypothetical protein